MSDAHENDSTSPPRGYKRKRVAKACFTCRSMKSKCDGKQPACSRCVGFGYQCAYSAAGPCRVQGYNELRKIMGEYHQLAETLQRQSESEAEATSPAKARSVAAATELSLIRARANSALESINASMVAPHAPETPEDAIVQVQSVLRCAVGADSPPETPSMHGDDRGHERYLGEVSDIQFFNLVKRTLQSPSVSVDEREVDSYEQDERMLVAAASQRLVKLPSQEQIERWTGVYFTTIHLAYPFIPQVEFVAHYKALGKERPKATVENALLYVLCAIGIYYSSFPGKQTKDDNLHELFFLRAQALAASATREQHTLAYIRLLLAQCFYFLAVCSIDSCWTVLGKAVRIAQSIGLHVEPRSSSGAEPETMLQAEKRRRVWYSIYVLDRLLSLQLGRPPAIHDDDCCVPVPSRVADGDIDWQGSAVANTLSDAGCRDASVGDYFLAVISFSRIVGFVLRSLYSPRASRSVVSSLASTQQLDQQLTQWKMNLPRTLRFDLGHVFSQTVAYKRQRNMLAVKYHHLRALIHRPYLCYPLLRSMEGGLSAPTTAWSDITLCEKICIAEAHATARLLPSISSQASLVHDFPWWQMISCLVCAGSILVVSSVFSQQTDNEVDGVYAEALSDDAETCLRVFEALSSNSTGARIARNMLEKLKQCGTTWRAATSAGMFTPPMCTASTVSASTEAHTVDSTSPPLPTFASEEANAIDLQDSVITLKSNWPAEIVDSMSWSAQFFQAAYQG